MITPLQKDMFIKQYRITGNMMTQDRSEAYKADMSMMNEWTRKWCKKYALMEEWRACGKNNLLFYALCIARDYNHFFRIATIPALFPLFDPQKDALRKLFGVKDIEDPYEAAKQHPVLSGLFGK